MIVYGLTKYVKDEVIIGSNTADVRTLPWYIKGNGQIYRGGISIKIVLSPSRKGSTLKRKNFLLFGDISLLEQIYFQKGLDAQDHKIVYL